jgi:D-alanyl-D-alanine carboxypeptidase
MQRVAGLACAALLACGTSTGAPADGGAPEAGGGSDVIAPDQGVPDGNGWCQRLTLDPTALANALAATVASDGVVGAMATVRLCGASWHGGAGLADTSAQTPMPPDGEAHFASLTKMIVATVVMQLVGEGKLSLGDPISNWTPAVPNGAAITVRMILSHTSGLFAYSEDPGFFDEVLANPSHSWTPQELLAVSAMHAPYFAPGAGYHYSNTNFIIAGLIVEAILGTTAAAAIHARVLMPLSLGHTFLMPTESPPPLVRGYTHLVTPNNTVDPTASSPIRDATDLLGDYSSAWTTGGIVSIVDDLAIVNEALVQGRLVAEPELAQMLPTQNDPDVGGGYRYGLGVMRRETSVGPGFGHNGDTFGYYAETLHMPNAALTVTVVVNDDKNGATVRDDVIHALGVALGAP